MMILFSDSKTKFFILLIAVNLVLSTSFSDISDNDNANREKARDLQLHLERKAFYEMITGRIIDSALKYIGVPHKMGGTYYNGMDCSGLLVTAFGENGIYLPHSCRSLSAYGTVIREKHKLMKGDLIFFKDTYKSDQFVTHTGLYIGEGKFVHSSSKRGVTITSLDNPWWQAKFAFGARILQEQS
jgi:cell wall-associated NlpC family hydrolase